LSSRKQDKGRLTLLIVVYFTEESQCILIKIHTKPLEFSNTLSSSSACAMKYNKIRHTITAPKICNLVKYGTRSG
jgi:hypothetical protein